MLSQHGYRYVEPISTSSLTRAYLCTCMFVQVAMPCTPRCTHACVCARLHAHVHAGRRELDPQSHSRLRGSSVSQSKSGIPSAHVRRRCHCGHRCLHCYCHYLLFYSYRYVVVGFLGPPPQSSAGQLRDQRPVVHLGTIDNRSEVISRRVDFLLGHLSF